MRFHPSREKRKTVMIVVTKLRYSLFLALALMFVGSASGPLTHIVGVSAASAQTTVQDGVMGAVLFEGNQAISDNDLITMIDLGNLGVFNNSRLQTDLRTIQYAYDKRGFTGARVTARTETTDNGRVRVIFEIDEGERSGIAAINFSGNAAYDENFLKSLISSKETHLLSWLVRDDSLDQEKLNFDGEVIRQYYINHGYPDAQILSAISEFDASRNAYFVTFTISEGEYYTLGGVGIETSIVGLNTEALKNVVRTYEGEAFSARNIGASTEEMAFRATTQGYSFADVRARLNRDVASRTFNVTYLVDEGARIYVERINITGNTKTRDFVIRRELEVAEGDPFNRSLITRGKSKIQGLGFFSVVKITTAAGSAPDKIVINIAVEEKSTGDYGASIGYESSKGILGEVSLTETNFLGRGQYLKVSVGAAQAGRSFEFSFTEPRFMGMKISSGLDVYHRISDETASSFFGSAATGAQLRIGVPIADEITSTFFIGGEMTTFVDAIAPASVAFVTDGLQRNKAFIGYTLSYNNLDNEQRPTSGFLGHFTQQYAGLDNNYVKSEFRGRYFVPLNQEFRIVASVKGQAGIINDFSAAGTHPTESFILGPRLVRGFEAGGMGGRAASGQHLGAQYYAGISAEIEFPIPVLPASYGIRGAIWADAAIVGDPSPAAGAVASGILEPVRASVGGSIIWDSPFGPLRGDFAHVVQQDTGDRTQVFQLTISSLL